MSPRPRPAAWMVSLLVLVVTAFVLHVAIGGGSSSIDFATVIGEIVQGKVGDDTANTIVWQLRVPRALAAVLAGAILGATGAALQAFFRNPLAEPYVIGVSSGAGLGGTVAIVIGFSQAFATLGTVTLAFLGGLLSLWIVIGLAKRNGAVQVHTLLLAGVVTSAMLSALMTTVLMLGGHDTGRILRWLLGSLTTVFAERLWAMFAVLVVGLAVLQSQTRYLNVFSVSEFTSERLGVDPKRLSTIVLVTSTAMVSVAVGTVGIIGFLGLIAPHVARRLVGIDLRRSLLASALLGSTLLLAADFAAQNIHPDYELPVGAITALIGAPALLALLKRQG